MAIKLPCRHTAVGVGIQRAGDDVTKQKRRRALDGSALISAVALPRDIKNQRVLSEWL